MTDQQFHQLRFDICENVRLHTHQPQIKQLLELDLYPDVEINEKGDHLKIEGFLRLKGAYYGEEADKSDTYDDEKKEELSYLIPVEITLPSDRAQLKHISAEIESFDYQVLSPFELQIDAILLIDGLIPEKDEELAEVVERNVPMFSGAEAIIETQEQAAESESLQEENLEGADQKEAIEETESRPVNETPSHHSEKIAKVEQQQTDESSVEHQAVTGQEEKTIDTETESEQDSLVAEEESVDERDKASDDWAKWLLREKEENFTSMRMVIVQEHDSVKNLAERYEISPSQIRQVNGLADREPEKGEIIYIPNRRLENVSRQD